MTMTEKWTVMAVADAIGTGGYAWETHAKRPDGAIAAHIFPKVIFEVRAAEYDIDPADIDTLLDVVLHEPHIPDATQARNHATDAAALLGHVADDGTPVHLYNATTVAHARIAHLARVEACKRDRVHITSPQALRAGGDPLDVIRSAHSPDPARIEAIAEYVHHARRLAQQPRMVRGKPRNTTARRRPYPWHPDWSA